LLLLLLLLLLLPSPHPTNLLHCKPLQLQLEELHIAGPDIRLGAASQRSKPTQPTQHADAGLHKHARQSRQQQALARESRQQATHSLGFPMC
jgi:hypothetical protein